MLDATSRGPASLLLVGPAGIGKTALVRRAVAEATSRGFHVLLARPAEAEAGFAFAALGDLLAAVPPAILDDLPEPLRRALDVALLRTAAAPDGVDPRAVAMAALACVERLAAGAPVLIVIDDAQWLDRSSGEPLAFMARRTGTLPVGILAVTRTIADEVPLGLDRLPEPHRLDVVRPGRLSLAGVQRMIRDRLGVTFARPVLARIEHDSGGNPFYALQIAEALASTGTVPRAGEALPVPDTLERLVLRRVERAEPRVRSVVEVLAVLGPALHGDVLALLGDPDAEAWLDAAWRSGLVEAEGERLALAHPLIASLTAVAMPAPRRRDLHRAAAAIVRDPEARAGHLAAAAAGPDEEVARALDEAAERAARRGAIDGAAAYAALACAATDPGDVDGMTQRRIRLGTWQHAAGDPVAAEQTLRAVVDDAPSRHARARALMALCWMAQDTVGYERATELGEAALREVPDEPAFVARIHADVSRLCDFDTSRKLAHAEAAMAILAGLPEPEPGLVTRACLALADARFFIGGGLSVDLVERARAAELADAGGRSSTPLTDRYLTWVLAGAGDLDEAYRRRLAFYRTARAEAPSNLHRALGWLVRCEIDRGDWPAAERHAEEHLDAIDWAGGHARAWPLSMLATVHALTGRLDEARAEAAEARALTEGSRDIYLTMEALRAQALVDAAAGDAAAVVRSLAVVDVLCERIGPLEPAIARHHADLVEALVATGDLDGAGVIQDRLWARAAGASTPWAVAFAARAGGWLRAARGDTEGGLEELDRSVEMFTVRIGMPFELGRALLERGIVLRRADRRRRAVESLQTAIAIFEHLGAAPWLARARDEVARVPVRRSGGEGLTPTETRVAELAANGASNREIAAALFIEVKTVEANLTRIYGKLGVRSRAGLATALAGRQPQPS
jgi:DNA-binding CsgD family transcriptional regulator